MTVPCPGAVIEQGSLHSGHSPFSPKLTSYIPSDCVHITLTKLSYAVLTELGFFIPFSLPFLLFQVVFSLYKCYLSQKCQLPH